MSKKYNNLKMLDIKLLIIFLAVSMSVAGLISYFSGFSFLTVFVIVVIAMFVNSFIAEVEDSEPGGFLNPDGDIPQWPLTVTFEDGDKEQYSNEEDLENNLEFFDYKSDVNCNVYDASGSEILLVLDKLKIKELKLKNSKT